MTVQQGGMAALAVLVLAGACGGAVMGSAASAVGGIGVSCGGSGLGVSPPTPEEPPPPSPPPPFATRKL